MLILYQVILEHVHH